MPELALRNRESSSFDAAQSNEAGSLLASAGRTGDTTTSDQTNWAAGGVTLYLDITVNGSSETITLYLQGKCPITGNYVNQIGRAHV